MKSIHYSGSRDNTSKIDEALSGGKQEQKRTRSGSGRVNRVYIYICTSSVRESQLLSNGTRLLLTASQSTLCCSVVSPFPAADGVGTTVGANAARGSIRSDENV